MKLRVMYRIWFLTLVICSLAVTLVCYFLSWEWSQKIFFSIAVYSLGAVLAHWLFKDINEGLDALKIGLLNLKDGEFSTTLTYSNKDELGQMCQLYNQTIDHMRQEKRWLYQRELLLDKITQSSPEVLFLVNHNQQIVFSNIAAKRFFNAQHKLEGMQIHKLLSNAPPGVESAVKCGKDGLFSINVPINNASMPTAKNKPNKNADTTLTENQTWHMSTGSFVLNNQSHKLYILKQMTRELSRQEVAVWKKVIRVISHELNNSLGPISSMLHSGRILSLQVDESRLARVFSTIDERIKHLSEFVQGYGQFAKIPEPKVQRLSSQAVLSALSQQWQFEYDDSQNIDIYADPAQLEQLLINLLKNAHESGSDAKQIKVEVVDNTALHETVIFVSDAGKGVAPASLQSVLIPFYSTKSNGTGLGLALCREIIDAHHGHIALNNREQGGLLVRVSLPALGSN